MVAWALLLALGAGEEDWECRFTSERWAEVGLEAPCKVVKGTTPTARLTAVKKAWKLTPAQAQCALEAASVRDRNIHGDDTAHLAWRRCVEKWPEQLMLWQAAILTWAGRTEFTSLIGKLPPAPADGGRSLADQLLDLATGPEAELAASILQGEPSRLAALLRDERLGEHVRFELAWAALEKRQPSEAEWEAMLEPLLMTPLMRGHWLFAAELWLRLPAPLRVRAAASIELAPLEEKFGGSARPRLALGLIAIGRKDEAKRLVLGSVGKDERDDSALIGEAVTWNFTGQRSRPVWDSAIAARLANQINRWEAWAALMPFLHPHQTLFTERFARVEKYERERPEPAPRTELEKALAASSARGLALLKKQLNRSLPATSDAGMALAMATLPEALPSPFVERSAPWKGSAPKKLDPAKVKVPRRYWPIRAEQLGKRRVVLATSQRFDPVGEVSPGGYWLLVSEEGAEWKEIYLCLSDHRPFHALGKSAVPLLDAAGVVRLAMEDAPIDEASIMFPPLATRAPMRRASVLLEAPLAALTKDTDGDGLADLVEARLLLDPKKKDTDGDGVADGDDPTPRLDDRLAATPLAEIYNAFFEDFLTGRKQPQPLVVPPGSPPFTARPREADLDDVRFLRGEPAELGGLRPLVRVVTLSDAEWVLANGRFGEFYPMEIEITLDGPDHALISWSERWRGGTCRVDRDATGTLVVTVLSSWIT